MGDAYLHGGSGTDGSADRLPAVHLLHLEILKISAFLAMFRKIIVLIPLIYILPVFLEDHVQAVFLAEPIADVIAVVTTLLLFRKNFKKVLSEMKQKSETQDV